ncbi:hypothetical protein JY28_02440 [Neisseria meningitidis]|nr:hypothetical protein JY28_02440 [Neisseria meningitidis]
MVVCRPAAVIPANAGIQQHNAAGLYRKKPKPHRRHSRKSWNPKTQRNRNLSEKTETPTASFPQKRESRPVGTESYRIKQFP